MPYKGFFLALFISPERRQLLETNHLGNFDDAWVFKADWFEVPNERRGGWSGVCRIALPLPEGGELGVFLKRQENHQRRTWRHPIAGEPSFACEFNMLRYLEAHKVLAPRPLFFGSATAAGKPRGILMTQELAGYRPLDVVVGELFSQGRPPLAVQRLLLRKVASLVRQLHDARVMHRSLYPKHLFVRWEVDCEPEVAVIDLEKSRTTLIGTVRTVYDLATLTRHSGEWSRSARLYFLLQYLGLRRLTPRARRICRWIAKRAQRKRRD